MDFWSTKSAFFCVAILWTLLCDSDANTEVLGCGGFVRSKKNIDVSRIQMALFSKKSGNIRKVGSTDCAPINGYYFIPVEENGEYVLKATGPRGWKLTPTEIPLTIDGISDPCSKGEDLNFEFVGFGITGSVLSKGSSTGPAGIDIELLGADGQSVLQSSTTNDEGHFDFFGVTPGSYVVRVSSDHAKIYDLDSNQRSVEVGEDVGVCEPFRIMGYLLRGSIQSSSGKPFQNVQLVIKGAQDDVRKVRPDSSGKFVAKVPNGNYRVQAVADDAAAIKFGKSEMDATIFHQSVSLPAFVVESFTVQGKVLTHPKAGGPLAKAKVEVTHDGKTEVVATAEDGSFSVRGVQKGPMELKVSSEGFDFDALVVSTVEPGDEVPLIAPARYLLTGKVERDSLPDDTEVRIKFTSMSDSQHNGRVLATDRGTYSVYLPSGRYRVAVELSIEQANIGFAPLNHDINIIEKPVHSINFQPVKANIEGHVVCLASDCTPVEISLLPEGSASVGAQKMISGAKGKFRFEGVLPGMYQVRLIDNDRRCWSETTKKISVSEDVTDIIFKQTGFSINVISSRPSILVLSDDKENELEEISIGTGNNVVCLKSQTAIRFSTKGCEVFQIEPAAIEDPSSIDSTFKVSLKPIQFKVSGVITSKSEIPDLKLIVSSDQRKFEVETVKATNGYAFELLAFPNEDLSFQPQSEEHLFDPESLHVFVNNDCHLDAVHFEANTGFFLRGKVIPAVEGVRIDLVDMSTRVLRQSVLTNKEGTYKVGPLPADVSYDVVAEKEGYIFETLPESQGIFSARKLASIAVNVIDGASKDPLQGVVISISGGTNYRSNTVTKSDGDATFLSLAPGSYFAKPQIKEYEFEPKHAILELVEGQPGEVTFVGKRVAFSVFGKVSSLNGEPEAGVVLKASGTNPEVCIGHTEEATSEAGGDFRFRGLQPTCEYTIKLQSEKQSVEKLLPAETKVLVGENDTFLTNPLIAMRSFEYTDTTLKVIDGAPDATRKAPLVKVTVTSDYGFSFSYTALTGQLITLPRVARDEKRYTIHVESVSTERFSTSKRAVAHFRADEYYKYIEITITKQAPTATKSERKISSIAYILPFIFVALATYVFWDKVPFPVRSLIEKTFAGSSPSVQSTSADGDWDTAKKRSKKRV